MQKKLDIMKRMVDPNWDPNKEAQIKAAQAQRQAPAAPAQTAQTAQTGMNAQKTLSAKTPKEFWDALGPKMQQSIVDYTKSGRSQEIEKKWSDNYKKYPNAVVVLKQMLAAVARKYSPAINTSTQANASSTQPTTTQLTVGQEARAQAARESAARTQNVREKLAVTRNQAIIPPPSKPRNSVINQAIGMLGYGRGK
jgi:hypothetical protein